MSKPKFKYKLKSTPVDNTSVGKVTPKLYKPDIITEKNLKAINPDYKPQSGDVLDYMQQQGGLPKIGNTTQGKSNYSFEENKMYLNNTSKYLGDTRKAPLENYFDELSHGVQNKTKQSIKGTLGSDYNVKGSTEYQAHKEIEPELYNKYNKFLEEKDKALKKLKYKPKVK